jgi:HK97 family phage major capsid protein
MNMEQIKIERRNIKDALKAGTMSSKDATEKLTELDNQERSLNQANIVTPVAVDKDVSFREFAGKIKESMIQKRSVTLNGTELVANIRTLFEEQMNKDPILSKVSYYYGPNGITNIPVLSPHLADPVGYPEGANNIAEDKQANLRVTTLTPRAFASVLPISAETLSMGLVDFESELPKLFARIFSKVMHKQILTGDGTGQNFTSIISGASKQFEIAGTTPKISDLAQTAVQLGDYFDGDAAIVMHYNTYNQVMSDNTVGVAELYKEELIRTKTIEGVKIILTGDHPSYSGTSGSVVWSAGPLNQYAVGIASEVKIEPINVPTSTQTYFRAISFMNGKPIVPENFGVWLIA